MAPTPQEIQVICPNCGAIHSRPNSQATDATQEQLDIGFLRHAQPYRCSACGHRFTQHLLTIEDNVWRFSA